MNSLLAKAVQNPKAVIPGIISRVITLPFVPDKAALRVLFRMRMGYRLNLESPITMNEKLQWLKIYNHDPLQTVLVDKVLVKEWAAEKIGQEHVVETLSVWCDPGRITLEELPEQFVLKTNHDSGSVFICRDKNDFDLSRVAVALRRKLAKNYFYSGREWPYLNIKPMVFAERYLQGKDGGKKAITDYKFTCFNGVADCVMVCTERETGNPKFLFFDKDWNLCKFNKRSLTLPDEYRVEKPEFIDEMFDLAAKLSEGFPYVRVDFYYAEDRIYFGEMTFYPHSGFDSNVLLDADKRWGQMMDLSLVQAK